MHLSGYYKKIILLKQRNARLKLINSRVSLYKYFQGMHRPHNTYIATLWFLAKDKEILRNMHEDMNRSKGGAR